MNTHTHLEVHTKNNEHRPLLRPRHSLRDRRTTFTPRPMNTSARPPKEIITAHALYPLTLYPHTLRRLKHTFVLSLTARREDGKRPVRRVECKTRRHWYHIFRVTTLVTTVMTVTRTRP